jgi:predicted enzyme related to lactoylglutathione lyase
MRIVTQYPDGVFCWVDLTTTDVEGAKAFYGGLFGWESDDRQSGYTVFRLGGYTVAGVGPMSQAMRVAGAPPVWLSYVKHEDVDGVAARAAAAGGVVTTPPLDVPGDDGIEGRMAIIDDPTGATFGVWRPGIHAGAQLVNAPGALIWNELQTRDAAAAEAFYGRVFGWESESWGDGYRSLKADGRSQCGMLPIGEEWGEAPSNWAVYFMVDDAAAAAARAEALGGTVVVPPTPMGQSGTFAVIRDPQGAHFTLSAWTVPADEPPGETREVTNDE